MNFKGQHYVENYCGLKEIYVGTKYIIMAHLSVHFNVQYFKAENNAAFKQCYK